MNNLVRSEAERTRPASIAGISVEFKTLAQAILLIINLSTRICTLTGDLSVTKHISHVTVQLLQ